jgi:hypothetical protein
MICEKCKKRMVKVDRYIELEEPEYELSEGQEADYWAALESGDTYEWDNGIVEYECKDCNVRISEINESVKEYDGLICMWHEKAKRGDFFSRYIFEFIAFNSYLKSRVLLDEGSERRAIQRVKKNLKMKRMYFVELEKDIALKSCWTNLIKELKQRPLLNSSRDFDNPTMDSWWNISDEDEEKIEIQKEKNVDKKKGIVRTIKDWPNMIEYWYGVRNNLFHGGKRPDVQRDLFLVEHAYKTLSRFMHLLIKEMNVDIRI